MTPKIDERTITFDADDMQKKASLPFCFSIVPGVKTGGPLARCWGNGTAALGPETGPRD